MSTRIAMAQMLVRGGRPDDNLARAEDHVRRAGRAGARVVVLPECLDLGWTDESARELAQPIPGAHAERLAQAARASSIYVAAGLVERDSERLYNSALLIDPRGRVVTRHRKIHELDVALDLYATGSSLEVVDTEFGRVGLDICADNSPDALCLGHALARMGAEIILSPSSWAVVPDHDHARDPYGSMWRDAYRQLASLYDLTIVGVSNVGELTSGPWRGHKAIGCSMAVGPDGVLAEGPYGEHAEALVCFEFDPVRPRRLGTPLSDQVRLRGGYG